MEPLHSDATSPLPVGGDSSPAGTARGTRVKGGPWARQPIADEREPAGAARVPVAPLSRPGDGAETPASEPVAPAAEEPLIDVTLLADYVGFGLRAIQRHAIGALATLVLTLAAVGVLVSVWPKTYEISGRILVRSTSPVDERVNPDHVVSREGQGPTLAAQEIVKSRDNVEAMMKATNLLEEWQRSRTPIFRAKDWVFEQLRGGLTDEQRVDSMAGLLDERMQVGANDEGTVSFVIRWPDSDMGLKLVDHAMKSFLEHRRVTEEAAITDSIAILEQRAETIEGEIQQTLGELPEPRTPRVAAAPRPRRFPTATGPSAEITVRLARLRSEVDERQREVARLEGVWTQQRTEAQSRLTAALTIYTEGHPNVVSLRQTLSRLSAEPNELAAARREARRLETDYDELSTRVGAQASAAERDRLLSQYEASAPVFDIRSQSGDADPVLIRLKNQMAELAVVQQRASSVRAEMASAKKGFPYQYQIVQPPRKPREPVAPNVLAILGAGLIASLLLAVAVAVAADLTTGRALEAWQVERLVRAPIAVRVTHL